MKAKNIFPILIMFVLFSSIGLAGWFPIYNPFTSNYDYIRDLNWSEETLQFNRSLFGDGTAAEPSISFILDNDTGFYKPSLGNMSVTANGMEIIRFSNSGGFNQTIISPGRIQNNAGAPSLVFGDGDTGFFESVDDILQVAIGGTSYWRFTTTGLGVSDTSRAGFNHDAPTATNPVVLPSQNDGNTGLGLAGADALSLISGGVEAMRLNISTVANGNFSRVPNNFLYQATSGDGTDVVNAFRVNVNNELEILASMNIQEGITFATDSQIPIFNMPMGDAAIGTLGGYWFQLDTGNVFSVTANSDGTGGVVNQTVKILEGTDFVVNTSTLFVDASAGRVGIGTVSPGNPLHIYGSGSTILEVETAGTGTQVAGIEIGTHIGTWEMQTGAATNGNIAGDLGFLDNDAGLYRMVIKDTGNVGINTPSPSATLHINGTVRIDANILFNQNGINNTFMCWDTACSCNQTFNGTDLVTDGC